MRKHRTEKLCTAILAAVLFLLMLSACGKEDAESENTQVQSQLLAVEAESQPQDSTGAEDAGNSKNDDDSGGSSDTENAEKEKIEPVVLNVNNIAQMPELPNGCEGTALATVLSYFGYEAEKTDMALNYIPRQDFVYTNEGRIGGHPQFIYAGNPEESDGYYCYTYPVKKAANTFLEEHNAPFLAEDITGEGEQTLTRLLEGGLPVIVWVTKDGEVPKKDEELEWTLAHNNEEYVPLCNLHVMVLHGYDENDFYVCDPLENYTKINRNEFMDIYYKMGSRAVVIAPNVGEIKE